MTPDNTTSRPHSPAASNAGSRLKIAGFLAALSLLACSPAPTPPAGTPTGTETATAPPTTAVTTAASTTTPTSPSADPTTTTSTPAASATFATGPTPDPTCTSCLNGTVSWGSVGGNAAQRDRSTADPCRVYHRTRTFSARAGNKPPISCGVPLPCDTSDTGSATLAKLLSHPDVKKALTTSMTIYGCDMRPVDGTLYQVEIEGGRSFGVGGECSGCSMGSTKCVTPPAGVKALVVHLQSMDEKMLATDPCKSALGPG